MTSLSPEKSAQVRAAILQAPSKMALQMARDLEVPEVEIVRHYPPDRVVELDAKRWQELVEAFEDLGSVHVIVSNGAATLEVVGRFGNFSVWGEFFNVQSDSLDMHIRHPQIASVFAVEKPSHMTGESTLSFQFFDRAGQAAFKVFLNFGGKPTQEMSENFRRLRETFQG